MAHPLYGPVAARAGFRCEYCQAPERVSAAEFEVDHCLPRATGGSVEIDNLALACRSCNSRKGAAVIAFDPVSRQPQPLFNPRMQPWEDHFRLDTVSGRIEGRDGIGRATVRRLGMNRRRTVRVRRLWIVFGLW